MYHLLVDRWTDQCPHYRRFSRRGQEEGSDEDSDAISEEEEEEESSEEEEVAPQSTSAEPEMSRAQRKELKKQQGAKKAAAEEDDEDEDLINPNHVKKQLTISDLGKPKELTRRERYVMILRMEYSDLTLVCSEQKEKQDAKDRYWKVCVISILLLNLQLIPLSSCIWLERRIRLRLTWVASRRLKLNVKLHKRDARQKLKVCVYCFPGFAWYLPSTIAKEAEIAAKSKAQREGKRA